ncbi:predicted protein [Sclerotinia sclerotiorum 1980 UF-70]|uniref:Uncharacterized protein n=1 Tax=Sclerotinia sclerotiorum (strain ATCC 18683 / 1980 / Ss-1) TaxID=665079 RepID=A7F3A1_SCLS1|nr:predicted protein [Sclerotinia sclerotiorum 1980 UF-70]EDN97222.1 predicted protein [Sclerotinia sclerotiorum 1980 UF-70]
MPSFCEAKPKRKNHYNNITKMPALANVTHVPMELMELITNMINTPKDEYKCRAQL